MELQANPMALQPMDVRGEAQLQPAFSVIEKAISDKRFREQLSQLAIAEKFRCAHSEN